jgi:hypothetical protein
MNVIGYKNLLGTMESGNNYKAVSTSGALGRYQFIPDHLNYLGLKYDLPYWKDPETFLGSPLLQEMYMDKQIIDITNYIEDKNLSRYYGTVIRGSLRFENIAAPLNLYGLLAGAHLAGKGALRSYFLIGSSPDDGFTSLTDYMVYFSEKMRSSIDSAIPILALAIISGIVLYLT